MEERTGWAHDCVSGGERRRLTYPLCAGVIAVAEPSGLFAQQPAPVKSCGTECRIRPVRSQFHSPRSSRKLR